MTPEEKARVKIVLIVELLTINKYSLLLVLSDSYINTAVLQK